MSCPYYERDYVGVCVAYRSPYVPSLAEIEKFCLKDDFKFCPIFEAYIKQSEEKKIPHEHKRTWLHDIYSDQCILLKV
ncbi:MAG: hypothetical protein AB1638_01115 [Nitrospirota bacterium]